MALEQFENNAASTLDSGVTAGATSMTLATGEGALFPALTGSQYFYVTLTENTDLEIVQVTARSTDVLTVVRGQQGTSGFAFSAGAVVEQRLTKGTLEGLSQQVQEVSTTGPTVIATGRRVVVVCDTAAALIGLTCAESPEVGDRVDIIDSTGEAHMQRATLTRDGTQLINGETTLVLDLPYGHVYLIYTDTDVWRAFQGISGDLYRRLDFNDHFAASPTRAGTYNSGTGFGPHSGGGGGVFSDAAVSGKPGIIDMHTDTSASGYAGIGAWGYDSTNAGMFLDDGPSLFDAEARIPTLSTVSEEYVVNIGFCDGANDAYPNNSAYFHYDRLGLGTNWQCRTDDGSTTTTDSGITVVAHATEFHRFRIAVNDDGTEVVFLYDGVEVASHTANIPTSAKMVMVAIIKSAGTTLRRLKADRVHYHKVLT